MHATEHRKSFLKHISKGERVPELFLKRLKTKLKNDYYDVVLKDDLKVMHRVSDCKNSTIETQKQVSNELEQFKNMKENWNESKALFDANMRENIQSLGNQNQHNHKKCQWGSLIPEKINQNSNTERNDNWCSTIKKIEDWFQILFWKHNQVLMNIVKIDQFLKKSKLTNF